MEKEIPNPKTMKAALVQLLFLDFAASKDAGLQLVVVVFMAFPRTARFLATRSLCPVRGAWLNVLRVTCG
jgi:hypothetical protein